MRIRLRQLILSALLAGSIAVADEIPQRVVSLDYCADQYVLRMLPPDRVLAVSPDAGKAFSYMRDAAADYDSVRATAEDVLVLKPDLVVRSYGGGPSAQALFERAGVDVLQVPYVNDLPGIRDATIAMAMSLGVPEVGTELVAEFDRRLERVASKGKRGTAIYMTPTGVTSGPGTLIHEMLVAAGFENYAQRPGWQTIPLENLAYEQPDAVAGAFFDERTDHPALWSAMRHPIARKQMMEQPTALLQGAWTSCGGWFLMDAIEALSALPLDGEEG